MSMVAEGVCCLMTALGSCSSFPAAETWLFLFPKEGAFCAKKLISRFVVCLSNLSLCAGTSPGAAAHLWRRLLFGDSLARGCFLGLGVSHLFASRAVRSSLEHLVLYPHIAKRRPWKSVRAYARRLKSISLFIFGCFFFLFEICFDSPNAASLERACEQQYGKEEARRTIVQKLEDFILSSSSGCLSPKSRWAAPGPRRSTLCQRRRRSRRRRLRQPTRAS
jgi:hypothetical protein